jgi:hypothetical protein
MTINQIRHLLSAHIDQNLLEAGVQVLPNDQHKLDVISKPMTPYIAVQCPSLDPPPRIRVVHLKDKFSLHKDVIRAAYDHQSDMIYYSRVSK